MTTRQQFCSDILKNPRKTTCCLVHVVNTLAHILGSQDVVLRSRFFLVSYCILLKTHMIIFISVGIVDSSKTLFTYRTGESYDNFLDPGFTPVFLDETNSLFSDNTLEQQARDICGENEECLFDIAVTGKTSVGESTLESYNELQQRTNYSQIGGR